MIRWRLDSHKDVHDNAGDDARRLVGGAPLLPGHNQRSLAPGARMTLTPGARVGSCEILFALGAGGMGEVYRARDTRLARDVAVKVLPAQFADDAERLGRFTREAQTLAALNHPNIASIYDIEEFAGGRALVMELVEGDDLSVMIARGPMPLADALPIARQIADALEAAHDQGVIHRDLKPANIKVRADGAVKVLDFGLAKAMPGYSGAGPAPSGLMPANSPTEMSPAMTVQGFVLGTAAYMAPEQARGKLVDQRADIWAFGVVLFEMLTGKTLFRGDTVADVMAAVLTHEIEWRALPAIPPSVERVLRRCLDRDPRKRLRAIGDARLDLDDASGIASAAESERASSPRPASRRWAIALLVAATAVTVTAAAVTFAVLSSRASAITPNAAFVFPLPGPPDTRLHSVVVSPDGRSLVYAAESASGVRHLWVRDLEGRDVRQLEGTEGAQDPFWSPDSRMVGFFTDERLSKIDVATGAAVVLCETTTSRGGTWNRDGVIVFVGTDASLRRVSASGGAVTQVLALDKKAGENSLRYPSFLPDGKHVLFYSRNARKRELAGLWVVSLDTGVRKQLGPAASSAVYAAPGYLLYRRDRYLVAQPFDSERLAFTGDPTTMAEDVWYDSSITALTNISVASTGTLVFRTGGVEVSDLAWFDRKGTRLGVVWEPKGFVTLVLSADGARVLTGFPSRGVERDAWVYDLKSTAARQVTSSGDMAGTALFSSDGARAVFTLYNEAGLDVWLSRLGSGAPPEPLGIGDASPTDWRGESVVMHSPTGRGDYSLFLLDLSSGRRRPLVDTPANEVFGVVSPDGRWLAYSSDATGQWEIYVERFPHTGERWRVSNDGGHQPRWHPKGAELFYVAPDRRMMSARVGGSEATFEWDAPRPLFQTAIVDLGPYRGSHTYAVAPDGDRFLVQTLSSQGVTPAVAMLNWDGRLSRR